ncbi:glycogen debranching protein GlgX [Saccharospirillum mangrovi]|uniref:glycogen debranching protein GlgX n=1 Tax=Saccharospirillum mangrovi TaxID=2161747 RepID=UPI000D3568E1|nr:glycogen debranching protein GlgX [Saccharospirillum mangrovi]
MTTETQQPGRPYPLGASWQPDGINFAVFAPRAQRLWLCLFDAHGIETRIALTEQTQGIWHGLVAGLTAGQRYGFRADGESNPDQGLWFNPAKLLLDPYATALTGSVEPHPSLYAFDDTDSAPFLPKALTPSVEPFDWQGHETVRPSTSPPLVYELHVKGFSQQNPAVPEAWRGTFLGVSHPASVAHLTSLGVTAVQLMPCFAFMTERRLAELGLRNYWGYNPVGYFAPEPRYAVADAVEEFKVMVRALHQAGIEVIMDVVYNHSAEANRHGPLLNFKGLANDVYYRHPEPSPGDYVDYSGCHNSLDLSQNATLRLVLDSMRYWRTQFCVDGFRFDLAVSLGRERDAFSNQSAFFKAVYQDPVLAGCRLIAEPWDLGPDGYRVGQFPAGWLECNDAFRDTVRRFWRGDAWQLNDFIDVFSGSPRRFGNSPQSPQQRSQSLNLITYHDGYTLVDWVSYEQRHNEANGEDNRDGHGENFSRNWGVEGPTSDPLIQAQRRRMQRNMLATLLLSPGPAHLLGGDELSRSQNGNNNAYCQDNELSWFDWPHADSGLLEFVQQCVRLRQELQLNQGKRRWFRYDGQAVEGDPGQADNAIALIVNGDKTAYLLFNATPQSITFNLDFCRARLQLSTGDISDSDAIETTGTVPAWTLAVLQSD